MVSGRTRRRSLIQLASGAALGALLPERAAHAAPMSSEDVARLTAGELVRVPYDVDLPQGSYFGCMSYGVVPAPVPEVMAVLSDPVNYTHIIPWTLEARVLHRGQRDMQVFFRQGIRSANAAYVMLIRRESPGLLRFWMDPTQSHDIADVWGYFRVQPWEKESALVTYAALLRLDFGVVKLLFSEKIRQAAMDTPGVVRWWMLQQRKAKSTPG